MRSKKKRSPKLTRLEKMTKGLMLSPDEVKSKFTVREVEEKGRALFLFSRIVRKDSFVLEYEGDILSHDEAVARENIYEMNNEGCYILFFRFQGRRLAIDATRCFDSYARYLNHSREPNIRFHSPLLLDLTGQGVPRIAAYALRDIHEGEEIVFDYGISNGKIPWLRNRKRCHTSELSGSSSSDEDSSSSEDKETNKDVVMSIKRTPVKSLSHLPSHSYLSQQSKYSLPLKPVSSMLPSDGYGLRLIPVPSRPGQKLSYLAGVEGLGQPLKVMRSVESSVAKTNQSVILLSASDDSSDETYQANSSEQLSHRDPLVPFNQHLSSSSEVLESDASPIKILHVSSLQEEFDPSISSSSSTSSSSKHCARKQYKSSIPCISNVLSGSSVPKSFAPVIHSSISSQVTLKKCNERKSAYHVSSIPIETFKQLSRKYHSQIPSSFVSPRHSVGQYPDRSHIEGCKMNSFHHSGKCISHTTKFPVKTSSVNENSSHSVDETITLSDSDDDLSFLGTTKSSNKRNDFHNTTSAITKTTNSFENNSMPSQNRCHHQTFHNCRPSMHFSHMSNQHFENKDIASYRQDGNIHRNVNARLKSESHNSSLCQNETMYRNTSCINEMDIKITNVQSCASNFHNINNFDSCKSKTLPKTICNNEMKKIVPEDQVLEIIDDEKNQCDLEISSDRRNSPPMNTVSHPEIRRPRPNPHVAVVKPYSAEIEPEEPVTSTQPNIELTDEEIEKMKKIFGPLVLSSDSLVTSNVEKAINENSDFFSVLIGRGVHVNHLRQTVWKLFKASGRS